MRIIQVVNVRWFNATAWYGLYLSKLLQQAGHEVLVLMLKDTESLTKAKEWGLNTKTMALNTKNPFEIGRVYLALRKLIREFKPDVINCHRGESFLLFGLLRRRMETFKLIRTRGDQRLPKNNSINRWLHGTCADGVVATNSAMAGFFRAEIGLSSYRVKTIVGGVDKDKFKFDPAGRERVRAEFGFTGAHRVIGLMGRFDKVKGQRELINAVAILRQERKMDNLKLMLLGFETATSEAQVRNWIDEAGIRDLTVITGERQDLPACISAMDLGVVASLWSETIARAALEIMACGVPLVGTRVGVMQDLLTPKALVQPGDERALAELIERALGPGDFLEQLRVKQKERIRVLGAEDFLKKTLKLYNEA